MKILSLHFKNINSLEGEHRIDFNQAPIADAGVFAITGPNGSGKTSILDAMTLALYGETYRFNKPAEHVMTQHTAESFAEVEFMLGDRTYRSRWQVRRVDDSPEGALKPATMMLNGPQDEEQAVEQTPLQVSQKIAELSGMDFHRFTKSVVLAQGDFAAFLNALDSERMDILEKLTGKDIYLEYRQTIEQKHAQATTQLEQIKQDMAATPVMEKAALEAAEQDWQDFSEQIDEFKNRQAALDQQLDWVKAVGAARQKQEALENQRSALTQQRDENQQTQARIDSLQPALAFKDAISELDSQTAQITGIEQTLTSYRKELDQLQQQLAQQPAASDSIQTDRDFGDQKQMVDQLRQAISDIEHELPQEQALLQSTSQQLEGKKTSLSQTEQWLKEHAADQILLEDFPETGKLKSLRQELAELKLKLKDHDKWTRNTTSALKKNRNASKNLAKNIKLLKNKRAEDLQTIKDRTLGKSFEELEELRTEQMERVNDFLELYELAVVNSRVGKKGFFSIFRRNKQDIQLEEHVLIERQNTLQLEMAKEENIRKTLEKAVAYEALLKRMESERSKLEPGKPCPLCGALNHPYVTRPPKKTDSKKALADQRGKLQGLRSRADGLNLQLRAAQQQEQEQTEKEQRLQQARSQWSVLCNRLNIARAGLDIDNLSAIKNLLTKEKKQLKEIDKMIRKCGKLHQGIDAAEQEIQKKETMLEELKTSHEQLNEQWDNRPRELIELEKTLEKCRHNNKELTEKMEKKLFKLGESLPEPGQEELLFERLSLRQKEYQSRQLRQQVLREEIVSLEEKVLICQEDVDALNNKLAQQSTTLKNEEIVGLHLALVEKQKLIAEKEQLLAEQKKQQQEISQALQSKLLDSPYSGIDELKENLEIIASKEQIEQALQAQNTQLEALVAQASELQQQLDQLLAQPVTDLSEQEILEQRRQLQEKQTIAELEVKTLQDKIQKQQLMHEKYARLQQELVIQQQQIAECEADMALMADENSTPFRKKAQLEMVNRLTSQTNKVLEKINGRFYLRSEATEHGFALQIEDTRQHNSRRLPKSLSGGESFVVSLALALALAESTSNGQALDSLFLDEGFGYLDAESLNLVMSTLEGLKTHGKLVGIISHVREIEKRVKTQIETFKKPNGYSGIKMAAG